MRRWTTLAAMIVLLTMVAATATAGEWKTIDDDEWCRDGRWNDDRDTYCEVREITIPGGRDVIRVDGGANGGITVEGWDRDEIRIRVKIKGWARDEDDAEMIVDMIDVETDGRVIHAEGPKQKRKTGWSVSYRIMVPSESNLELEATNGGIAVADVEGDIYLDTTNGGLDITNLAGDVRGRTTNGGLHVELSGKTWRGKGLDVRSTNGGVDLQIPKNYNAELETGTVNGGIHLEFPVTVQGKLGKSLKATLGDGGPRLRVKTTNGGVHVSHT
jgi:DUF4097 and DUF4098 domain-containing protein YvlB